MNFEAEKQRLEATQMKFLRAVLGLTALEIRNVDIRGRLNVKKCSPRNWRMSKLLGKMRRKNEKH